MKMLNNFQTERRGQKMSAGHLYETEVENSNGDVISSVPRPLVTETIFICNKNMIRVKLSKLKNLYFTAPPTTTIGRSWIESNDQGMSQSYYHQVWRCEVIVCFAPMKT